jgi:hypothetical protein
MIKTDENFAHFFPNEDDAGNVGSGEWAVAECFGRDSSIRDGEPPSLPGDETVWW